MIKINKYVMLMRNSPRLRNFRYFSDSKCPPRYECKQPKPSRTDTMIEEARLYFRHPLFMEKHAPDPRITRNILYFLCLPFLICFYVNLLYIHPEKVTRPKFVKFTYLRIRRKKFPWDPVRTLFHNPKINALPDGYEEDIPEEDEIDPFY